MRNMTGWTAFLDMDGVKSDFFSGACRAHGANHHEVAPRYYNVGHDRLKDAINPALSEVDFWRPISGNATFWFELPAYGWMWDLLGLICKSKFDRWMILTTPGKRINENGEIDGLCPDSCIGKMSWLRRQFGNKFNDVIAAPTECKCWMANRRAVLIDDREANVKSFREAGGYAIAFPRKYSENVTLKSYSDDPVGYVAEEIEKLKYINC